jgi:O-antigen ligase
MAVLALAGLLVIGYQFAAREENQKGSYTEEDAKTSRYELWRAARTMFEAHPLLGVGSRRFPEYAQQYAEISHDNKGKVAHNTYLDVASTTGLLGFGSFLMMLVSIYRVSRNQRLLRESDLTAALCIALYVGTLTIAFRALLDSKEYDWSFYYLGAIGICLATLQKQTAAAEPETEADPATRPAVLAGGRPMIYRSRGPRPSGS